MRVRERNEEKLGRKEAGRRGGVREGWEGLERHRGRHREGKNAEVCTCILSSAPASSKLL